MKRSIIFISMMILAILSGLTACGSQEKNQTRNQIQNQIQYQNQNQPRAQTQTRTESERSIKEDVTLEGQNVGGLKEADILRMLRNYSSKIEIESREAKLDDETWNIIRKEHIGRKVNIEKTMELLYNSASGDKRNLVIEEVIPKTTADILSSNIAIIGSYTTIILDQKDERLNNIRLAAERLNYEKLQPGEEFSFNNTLGKRTERKGYEKAPIIIKTENGPQKAYGVGGGVCQLSSTLYNAARKAGLKVTERHSHSEAVGYLPQGRDAMVAYGSSDLKFVNSRSYPVMLRVYVSDNKLTVRIYENRN